MMRVYYAHCMALYGTPQERRDLDTLKYCFPNAEIVNPNRPEVDVECARIREEAHTFNQGIGRSEIKPLDPSELVMRRIFEPMVVGCDVLVYRALPDGRIPAGVALEITWARTVGNMVLELPHNITGRMMSVDATKEYLKEVGQR